MKPEITNRLGNPLAKHRVQTKGAAVTAVRERIERTLAVTTTARPEGDWWAIYFEAPANADLDFLRPDVLPPLAENSQPGSGR